MANLSHGAFKCFSSLLGRICERNQAFLTVVSTVHFICPTIVHNPETSIRHRDTRRWQTSLVFSPTPNSNKYKQVYHCENSNHHWRVVSILKHCSREEPSRVSTSSCESQTPDLITENAKEAVERVRSGRRKESYYRWACVSHLKKLSRCSQTQPEVLLGVSERRAHQKLAGELIF